MSTLRLTTISNQSGSSSVPSDTVISGSAKAWVNFNGTGTVAIRASFNVSSITDGGTGIFAINFTTPLADGGYSVGGAIADNAGSGQASIAINNSVPPTATVCSIKTPNIGGSLTDSTYTCAAIFR